MKREQQINVARSDAIDAVKSTPAGASIVTDDPIGFLEAFFQCEKEFPRRDLRLVSDQHSKDWDAGSLRRLAAIVPGIVTVDVSALHDVGSPLFFIESAGGKLRLRENLEHSGFVFAEARVIGKFRLISAKRQ